MRSLEIDRYIESLVQNSTPECTAWNIEKVKEGKPGSWNYIDGCMLNALLAISQLTDREDYFQFVRRVADTFTKDDGSIRGYEPEKHNLDDINEGRIFFRLYRRTGDEKYRRGADFEYKMLLQQPRTWEGNFWHKAIYPNQVWLDGIYMAQPFLTEYELTFGSGSAEDTVHQLEIVAQRMRDPVTGLYYHGYDASRKAFWANPDTGLSRNFWLRSVGWFAVALADILELLPAGSSKETVHSIFRNLMDSVAAFQDPKTGLYWQVMDQPGRPGNYLETSGSCMLAYAMLKGARLGWLDTTAAAKGQKTFDGVCSERLSFRDGVLNLGGICLVAGLGPENNRRRDGSYEYYISEPVVENDAKGVAPLVLCYTEMMRI